MHCTEQTWRDVVTEALRDLGGQAHHDMLGMRGEGTQRELEGPRARSAPFLFSKCDNCSLDR